MASGVVVDRRPRGFEPSRLAAIARTPEPVPTSMTVRPCEIETLQRREAQPRRRMVPGAEAHRGLNDDDEIASRSSGPV